MLHRNFNSDTLIDPCSIELDSLFNSRPERQAFATRLEGFLASDKTLPEICHVRRDILMYESESFIPPTLDPAKPSLFLIAGNPTPQSVALCAMYAYEGNTNRRQHRFWKVLHTTGILRFSKEDPDTFSPHDKMRRLYTGDYRSPFNVHIVPFFSVATPPGGVWGGVAGLRRLFGSHFAALATAECISVRAVIDKTAKPGDSVLVFQSDAYTALKGPGSPAYERTLLGLEPITTHYGHDIEMLCLPPTRMLYSRVTNRTLTGLAGRQAR